MIEEGLVVLVALYGPSLAVIVHHLPSHFDVETLHNLPHFLLLGALGYLLKFLALP